MARIALTGAVSNNDLAQYTTAAVIAPAKALILAWVANTGPSSEPTVSGGNVTFKSVATIAVPGGTNRRLSCLRAMSDTGFTGPLSITFGATQMACAWAVHAYTDVDTTGINGEGAIAAPTTKTNAADTMHSVALSGPPAPQSVVAGALMTRYSRNITPGAGLDEINVLSMAGDYGTLDTVDRGDGQPSASWSWTSNSEFRLDLVRDKSATCRSASRTGAVHHDGPRSCNAVRADHGDGSGGTFRSLRTQNAMWSIARCGGRKLRTDDKNSWAAPWAIHSVEIRRLPKE